MPMAYLREHFFWRGGGGGEGVDPPPPKKKKFRLFLKSEGKEVER